MTNKKLLIWTSVIETIRYENKHSFLTIALKNILYAKIFTIYLNKLKSNVENIKEFFYFLNMQGHKKKYQFFHNLSSLAGYLLMLTPRDVLKYKTKILTRTNKIYETNFETNKKKFLFKDIYLKITLNLKVTSESFKAKNKIIYDLKFNDLNGFIEKTALMNELKVYLLNDVKILYYLITNFKVFIYELFKIDFNVKLTLASLTQKIFLRFFLKYDFITLTQNYPEFVKKTYTCVIVYIYYLYVKKLMMLDVNSLYPYCMATSDFGLNDSKFIHKIDNLYALFIKHTSFVKVVVVCKENMFYILITIWTKFYQLSGNFKNNTVKSKIIKYSLNTLYDRVELNIDESDLKIVIFDIKYEQPFIDGSSDTKNKYKRFELDKNTIQIICKDNNTIKNKYKHFYVKVDRATATIAEVRIFMQKFKIYYTAINFILIEQINLSKINDLLCESFIVKLKIVQYINENISSSPKIYGLSLAEKYTLILKSVQSAIIIVNEKSYNVTVVLNFKKTFNVYEVSQEINKTTLQLNPDIRKKNYAKTISLSLWKKL